MPRMNTATITGESLPKARTAEPSAEETILHCLVREHLETFLAQVEARTGTGLPEFVKDEFDAFLDAEFNAAAALLLAALFLAQRQLFELAALMLRVDLFAFGGGFANGVVLVVAVARGAAGLHREDGEGEGKPLLRLHGQRGRRVLPRSVQGR